MIIIISQSKSPQNCGQNHHKLGVSPISGTSTLPALSVETRCVSFRRRCSSRVRAQRSHGYHHRGSRALSWCCQWSYLNPGWREKNMGNGVWGNFYEQKWGVNYFGQWWHRGRLRLFRCVWKCWTLPICLAMMNGGIGGVSYFQTNPES